MTLQLAGAGRSTVRADRGAVAEAQERRREQKEAAKVLRQLRELTAELDRRDEDKARMAEGGRATRNNQAAAWAPIDIVAQLQAELSAAQRQLAQSESHRASETKRLRDFKATITLMHSDHKEAGQWLKDKGDVHTDVLSLESELKTSKRETSAQPVSAAKHSVSVIFSRGKQWESTGKQWESIGKQCESIGKHRKAVGKQWESIGKHRKAVGKQ